MTKKKKAEEAKVEIPEAEVATPEVVKEVSSKGKFKIYTKKPYGDFVCAFETEEEAKEFLVGRDNCQIGNPKK